MAIKVRKQVASYSSYLAKKLLATHSTGSIGYYTCLFMQTKFQLGSYIHVCTNEAHFLQLLWLVYVAYNYACQRVGIKSCRFARECVSFVHSWM